MRPSQLPLNIRLDSEATFDNFYAPAASANAEAKAATKDLTTGKGNEQFLFLWGAVGTGRSHLLQAACLAGERPGRSPSYLPLGELQALDPAGLLEGLENQSLACLDDIDAVIGNSNWEEALFHLFNRMRECGTRLLVTAQVAPRDLPCRLPDLASRFSWGTVYRLAMMADEEKMRALAWRARARGLEMGDEVAAFIIRHYSREPGRLFECLEKLDRQSLAEKRKLTIPFVKTVL